MESVIDLELLDVLLERVRHGLDVVRHAIEDLGVDPESITIIGVTKGWGPEAVLAGLACGLQWFGENFADELVAKATAVAKALSEDVLAGKVLSKERLAGKCLDARDSALGVGGKSDLPPFWTFQGKLQSNKINRLRDTVRLWQTVDTVERAQALGSRSPGAEVLIQVMLDPQKGPVDINQIRNTNERGNLSSGRTGCLSKELPGLVTAARSAGLAVRGLMGVAPDEAIHGPGVAGVSFAKLRDLAAALDLPLLSMGMSNDYTIAVANGATHLRLGSVLFGSRTVPTLNVRAKAVQT